MKIEVYIFHFFHSDKEKQKSAEAMMPESHEGSTYDEVSMQQSMLFSDGLQVDSEFTKCCISQ